MIGRILTYATLVLAAVLFAAPIVFLIGGSLLPDELVMTHALGRLPLDQVSLQNFRDVFARVPFARYLLSSLVITGLTVGLGLPINAMAGYAFARLRWRGRAPLLAGVVALMIVPFEAIAVPLFYEVTRLGWRDTYLVQIVPFVANAFVIVLFRTYFATLPRELEDAARIDGANTWRTFWSIVVPNARPAFATAAILMFLAQWGMYLWPVLVTSGEQVRPLSLGIATFYTLPPLQWGDIFAFGVMMVAPVLVAFLVFQRWFVRSVAASGIRG